MFKVLPIDLLNNTSPTYDQNVTSLLGRISIKTLAGRQVVGPPLVTYRDTLLGPDSPTPLEIVFTDNDRLFALGAENNGLATISAYSLDASDGSLTYIGKITIQVPEPPATTYAIRGFKVVDDGTTNWKIFILYTANVPAHAGLYMVNNLALSDFTFVPSTIATATAPGQKAVYKLNNLAVNILNGTGLSVDKASGHVWVHRGVSLTHSFIKFDYDGTITTVAALGATQDLFLYETGNLPALSGTLLLTNSEDYVVPNFGGNNGNPCAIFHTNSTMYVGPLSQLTSGATTWPGLEFANNLANVNEFVTSTTVRAVYAHSLNKVVLVCSSSAQAPAIVVKNFESNQHNLYCGIAANENNESSSKEIYKFKLPAVPLGFSSRIGYFAMITSAVAGVRGIYTACFDSADVFDLTSIISPVLDVQNKILARFTVGLVRHDSAGPIKVRYRTSGFGSASGGWLDVGDDLDLESMVSATGQIQFKITYKVFENESTNATQLYSAGVVMFDLSATSDNWEYSHKFSTPDVPAEVVYRLKKAYTSTVPNLYFRAFDLSNNLYVQSTTALNAGLFEYSNDNGFSWTPLGTIPNTVGTLVRYTFAVSPGIDVRPSIREM